MRNDRGGGGGAIVADGNTLSRPKFGNLLRSDPNIYSPIHRGDDEEPSATAAASPGCYDGTPTSCESSPFVLSPWNNSPFAKSPWTVKTSSPLNHFDDNLPKKGMIGSIVREEGHIYSLAASSDLLYTGSDSKNIRVWKDLKEFSGFKSGSGLVKAIVISGGRIFTGHQDGKIRIWKISSKNSTVYRRIGNLPTTKDFFKSSMNPKNYVEVRRHRSVLRIKHYDAVSSLSLDKEQGILYSGSWDKTLKVWRISDFKCLESIVAHDDAVNSVVAGFDGLVFTGSADGKVKVWRREMQGKNLKHFMMELLLEQQNALTALAVNRVAGVVYCGSSDGLLNFWEKSKSKLSYGGVLRGHKLAVLCLAAAGRLVFSGSADKSICVWRRDGPDDCGTGTHTCLSVLTGHSGPVKCLAVEEDPVEEAAVRGGSGDRSWILYSGSLDKSVKVWSVAEASPEFQLPKQCASDCYGPPPKSPVISPVKSPAISPVIGPSMK